jgi:hypothetical protein
MATPTLLKTRLRVKGLFVAESPDGAAQSSPRRPSARHGAHDLPRLEGDFVCQVVTEDLPPLIGSLAKIVKPLSGTNS